VSDLTPEEQKNVRTAMRYLRIRCGGVQAFAKALRIARSTVTGRRTSASLAFRVARLAGIGVDDVLTGKFPPAGTCPHCGATSRNAAGDRSSTD